MIQVAVLAPQTQEEIISNRKEMLKTLSTLRESQRPLRIENMVEEIFNELKNEIEKGSSSHIWHTIYLKDRSKSELKDAMEIVKVLFIQAQYRASIHYFSDSWCRRSDKFGEFSIDTNIKVE